MNAYDAQSSQLRSLPQPFQAPSRSASGGPPLLERVLDHLLSILAPSQQPQIRTSQNRQGEPTWSVYDPMSRTTQVFFSEDAVRVWLEQRYYL